MEKRKLDKSEYVVQSDGSILLNVKGLELDQSNIALVTSAEDNKTYYNFASTTYSGTYNKGTKILSLTNPSKPVFGEELFITIVYENGSTVVLDSISQSINILVELQMETIKLLKKIYNPD